MPVRRRARAFSPFAFARRAGLYKGLLGGSRPWLIVGATMWGGRQLRRAIGRSEEVVAVEVLHPGQAIRLEAMEPMSRRQRKAAARTQSSSARRDRRR